MGAAAYQTTVCYIFAPCREAKYSTEQLGWQRYYGRRDSRLCCVLSALGQSRTVSIKLRDLKPRLGEFSSDAFQFQVIRSAPCHENPSLLKDSSCGQDLDRLGECGAGPLVAVWCSMSIESSSHPMLSTPSFPVNMYVSAALTDSHTRYLSRTLASARRLSRSRTAVLDPSWPMNDLDGF